MKKVFVLIAVTLCVGLITATVHATPVKVVSTSLISSLSVKRAANAAYDFDGENQYRNLGAGEFDIHIKYSDSYTHSTVSYCIDPYETIRQRYVEYKLYDVTKPAVPPVPANAPFAAYLMKKYAVAFTTPGAEGKYWYDGKGFDAEQIAAGLQLSIWKVLFGKLIDVNENQREGFYEAYELIYGDYMANKEYLEGLSSLGNGFITALNDGRQDQIYKATPTPEPTTMLLMGTGLLGLGVVSRRKMKN